MGDTTSRVHLDALAGLIGLSDSDFSLRKSYLELSEEDAQLLREFAEPLRRIHPRLMDAFYGHLLKFPQTREYLKDPQQVQQLRRQQEQYFDELLQGRYDRDYLINRIKVGIVHQRIGLSPDWYIGAYAKFLTALLPELAKLAGDEHDKLLAVLGTLIKVVFLDINLVLDTYAYTDKAAIENLRDYSESLVCNIPLGLIVVARDLSIVSSNHYMDGQFGIQHMEIKGKALIECFPGCGLHDRALEVITTQKPQFGVQLSINRHNKKSFHCEVSLTPISLTGYQESDGAQPALLIAMEDTTERDALIEQTRAYDNRVRAILDNVAEGIITIDESGLIESFNPAAEKLFGYQAYEVIGENIKRLMPAPYRDHHDGYLERYSSTQEKRCLGTGFREVEGLRKNGSLFPMDLSITELILSDKKLFIGIVRDITQRKQDEAEMAKLSLAIEQAADAIMITDNYGTIEYVNAGFESTTGYSRNTVVGKQSSILKSGAQDKLFYHDLWQKITSGHVFQNIFINRKHNGDLYYEEKTITPLRDHHGNITHFISTGKDITERMHTQKRLQFLAHHDVLTTLPNRLLFMEKIADAITNAKNCSSMMALLFLDLDRFKKINDTLGHSIGDLLLKQLSTRLRHNLRQYDTVARLSGDEFAVLLSNIQNVDDILPITAKILQQFNEPFLIEGNELFITTSIGIAVFPQHGSDPDTLLKNADTAMYAAKAIGRGNYSFYDHDMNAMASMHLQLENELRHALQREQFSLVYQLQYAAENPATILGGEVMIRWQHPTHGLLMPVKFIPMLEDTGLIKDVGEWIIHKSCIQLNAWRQRGICVPRMAINIAPQQFSYHGFADMVLATLRQQQLPAESLELEITESTLMQDDKLIVENLRQLTQAGVRVAMDDFGTGYSSLSYLRRFPVSTLKIDRTFINQIPHVAEDCELTKAIIAMAHSLNLQVIAEGVETSEQLQYLQELGCDGVQGFLLCRPLPAAQLEDSLKL